MKIHALRPSGYAALLVPVLAGLLSWWLLAGVAQAAPEGAGLDLQRLDTRYPLAALGHSSGFVAAPPGVSLEEAPARPPMDQAYGLSPDFHHHDRYWLYIPVVNRTAEPDWVLHLSNFGFRDPGVLLRGDVGQRRLGFDDTGHGGGAHINTLGRAVDLTLQPGRAYSLVVELSADHATWRPYVALMSGQEYQAWTTAMDLTFKLAVGVILGLILLGTICAVLTREAAFGWGSLSALLMLTYYLEHSSLPAILWQASYEKGWPFWLLMSSALLSQLVFAASFLGVRRDGGGWYRAFLGAALVTAVVWVLANMVPFEQRIGLYGFNYLVLAVVILGSGMAKVRAEGSYYVIYLLGWFPLVLSILQVALVVQGASSPGAVLTESYKMILVLYIQILHMLLHAVALILRVRALRREKLEAEFLSRSKSRFIAQSSHDLSQPLHAMSLFLSHLQPHVRGRDGRRIFQRLQASHRRLGASFQSIMDLGQLEAGAIQPAPGPVALAGLLRRLEREYRPLAEQKGLRLRVRARPVWVVSDAQLLERMLRNLIANAIKYTDHGGVLVGVRRRGERADIQVWDTGRGIGGEARERVFDIYQRAGDGEPGGGSGIGLSIVRHLAELLDHPVALASVPGKGSCFSVSAALPPDLLPAPSTAARVAAGRSRVALVMAAGDLREALSERLARWGCAVQLAPSLAALARGPTPAVVLCDPAHLDAAVCWPADTVVACVGEPGAPLPEGWLTLSATAPASRLRALINVAARRGHLHPILSPAHDG
jgi:signal transduction histidine kinase